MTIPQNRVSDWIFQQAIPILICGAIFWMGGKVSEMSVQIAEVTIEVRHLKEEVVNMKIDIYPRQLVAKELCRLDERIKALEDRTRER